MYTFFTYFKKIFHNHRKSLGKYFTSPFRYIYSIYIHSWAHLWHPFRKVFSSDCMEGMPTYKTHFLHTGAAHRTLKGFVNHCTFQQIKHLEKKKQKKNRSIPIQTLTFHKHSSNHFRIECPQLIVDLMAQETVFGLCAVGFLCPSCDSFGLIQLRCRMAHPKVIYTRNCNMIKKEKKNQLLFPYSKWERHQIL